MLVMWLYTKHVLCFAIRISAIFMYNLRCLSNSLLLTITFYTSYHITDSGTSACPPYHLAIVIGGLSAELTLKTVKMASTKYYDTLPTTGNEHGRAFRCIETEKQVLELT